MPKGIFERTKTHNDNISKAKLGHIVLAITREKLRQANLGKKLSEAHKESISKTLMGHDSWSKGMKQTEEAKRKTGEAQMGIKNTNWKGNDVGYRALHAWIRRHKGKPTECVFCKATSKERKLAFANVNHEYKRNEKDYISLCYPCHKKYDLKVNK